MAGARWLIDGASSIGHRFGMPQLLIGLTIVALGTSLPELVINVFASVEHNTDLAIGNVLGSNIINTLLVIGLSAMIYPISMTGRKNMREVFISLIVTLIFAALANITFFLDEAPMISQFDGAILMLLLAIFLFYTLFRNGALKQESTLTDRPQKKLSWSVLLIFGGIGGLFFGGKWIVDGAEQITIDFGISQSIVGMTIIAAATSLPELVTSILAALKKNSDLAVGNAIGSNLFNILLVLGMSAVITPIPFDTSLNIEVGILVASTLLVLLFIKIDLGKTNRAISSLEGIILVLLYLFFLLRPIFF
jgi:cation:H+ antiporter